MHRTSLLSVTVLGLLALAACQKKTETAIVTSETKDGTATAPPASMTSPPHRKAGLWTQTISTGGVNQTMKMCLDADTETKMTFWGQATGKNTCSKNSLTPTVGGWSFESTCEMAEAGTITSKGTVTGDFNSDYTVKISSTTTGAAMAQANGTHEMNMTAKWEGPCPAGMKGGDVQISIPGQDKPMTINVEQMSAMKK